jgi:hypothetical protein
LFGPAVKLKKAFWLVSFFDPAADFVREIQILFCTVALFGLPVCAMLRMKRRFHIALGLILLGLSLAIETVCFPRPFILGQILGSPFPSQPQTETLALVNESAIDLAVILTV